MTNCLKVRGVPIECVWEEVLRIWRLKINNEKSSLQMVEEVMITLNTCQIFCNPGHKLYNGLL